MNTLGAHPRQEGPGVPCLELRARLEDQTGAIAIIVAVMMVALLTLIALVVDLGGLYDHDRELQTAADAGALAGAQELVMSDGDTGAAATKTSQYVVSNTAPNSSVVGGNVTFTTFNVDDRSVTLDLREDDVPFFFAGAIGRTEGSVVAHAKAEVKYLRGVNQLFPVAMLMMTPEKFRFVFKKSGTTLGSFDVTDSSGGGEPDGVYDEGGGYLPSSASPGLYSVTLQAISTIKGVETVVLELPDIGRWWVSNPSNSKERLYRVGMSKAGNTITVKAEVSPAVLNANPSINSLSASLGGSGFWLGRQSDGTFVGSVSAPSGTGSNSGYGVHELKISFPKIGNDNATNLPYGAYVAFHPDTPMISVMMTPSFFDGYSRKSGEHSHQSARVEVRVYRIGDPYAMRLSNESKDGPLFSGNWRLTDLYEEGSATTQRVVAALTPDPGWHLRYPLVIGGELAPKTGNLANPVYKGLCDRIPPGTPDDDPRRVVIVPVCLYDPDLHGNHNYIITGFAAFKIVDYDKKGDLTGEFVRWVSAGEWQNDPPGPLYIETAVLTE